MSADSLYFDHAATTPLLPEAAEAMAHGYAIWANPSSPHRAGRAARSALEDARARLKEALAWDGEVIFTSGATEALSLAIARCVLPLAAVSPVEHDAVLRHALGVPRLAVDAAGVVEARSCARRGLVAVQHVNNETGVVQPLERIAEEIRAVGGLLLADCAQSAGKIDLPAADLIALSAHKFGGPVGIGALLVKDWAMLRPLGGQERGYRPGTENLPAVLGMVAALEAGPDWLEEAARLRSLLEAQLVEAGAEIVGGGTVRLPAIGAIRMKGVAAAVQLIRFDAMGIAVSAGSACSSGSLRTSHVLGAMGMEERSAAEVLRVSIGRETRDQDVERFVSAWKTIARGRTGE